MKGFLANIGAMALSSMALTLEKASGKMDINFCTAKLPLFLDELNELYSKLKEAFSVVCQGSETVEISPELPFVINRLLDAFGNFNIAQIEKETKTLKALSLSGSLKEEVEKIEDSIMMMDYAGATETMLKLAA
jgi:hypothetical protein